MTALGWAGARFMLAAFNLGKVMTLLTVQVSAIITLAVMPWNEK